MTSHPEVRGSNRRALGGLASIILGGAVAVGLGGCVSFEEELANGTITQEQYNAKKQQQYAEQTSMFGWGLMGWGAARDNPGAVVVGQSVAQNGAAQVGRSQQTVNVYNNPGANGVNNQRNKSEENWPVEVPKTKVFLCNSWIDRNGNGHADYNEFIGIKSRFVSGEQIIFVCDAREYTGEPLQLRIKKAESKSGENGLEDVFWTPSLLDEDACKVDDRGFAMTMLKPEYQKKLFTSGNYIATWYREKTLDETKKELASMPEPVYDKKSTGMRVKGTSGQVGLGEVRFIVAP